jgi:iron complex outermembrane recepter protein
MRILHPSPQKTKKKFPFHCGFVPLASFIVHKAAITRKPNLGSKRIVGADLFSILRKHGVLVSVALLCVVMPGMGFAEPEPPSPAQRYQVDIPALNAAEALNELAAQTGATFLFPYEQAKTRQANGIKGQFTLMNALDRLLAGSGLLSGLTQQGVIQISLAGEGSNEEETMKVNKKASKGVLAAVIGLVFGTGDPQGVVAEEDDGQRRNAVLEEIVVTAQKREESLSDVPMAISAVGADAIDKRNLVGMDDYLRTIPGVSFQDRGAGHNTVVIRGIATSPQIEQSTTGAYFGEMPIADLVGGNSTTDAAGGADIKLVDIERIEILRGPQGTLYGAGSMAGTVRIIPKAPQLDKMEGSLGTRYSHTSDNGGGNTMIQGVLNVPLIQDKLALRAVAYRFDNSGFVDNVAASQPTAHITNLVTTYGAVAKDRGDRGSDSYTGFRLAALWQISDKLDATLTYLNQVIEQDGLPHVNLDASGIYQQQRQQIGGNQDQDEFLESELDLTNLAINYDLGWGVITSASSWLENDGTGGVDTSWAYAAPWNTANIKLTEIFAQELRFASQWESSLQLVAGLYYEDKEVKTNLGFPWHGDPSLHPFPSPAAPFRQLNAVKNTKQKAIFGEFTYDLTAQWTATLGLRHFDYDYVDGSSSIRNGVPVPQNQGQVKSDETGQTYKGALSYKPSEDVLVYGQWAQGFRFGRGQVQSPQCTAAGITVPAIDSDRSETLELGLKSSWLDNRVVLNAAVYQIDWDDIPVAVLTPCFRTLNAGKAQSTGAEIELSTRLTENLQLDISASTVDATLEETSSIGNKGDDLPGSADYNASVGIEYNFAVADYPSFARLDYAYVGEYYNNVSKTGTPAGDFSQLHLKVGAQVGQINIDLFVNNLTNEDALTWVESLVSTLSTSNRGYRIRPRTIGMNIGYSF